MTSTPESPSALDEQAAVADAPASESAVAPSDSVPAESAAPQDESGPAEAAPAPPPIDEAVARELALAALHEITPAATIGDYVDASVADDGVLTLRFANRMAGYPGWFWTVGLAQVEDSAPTVLEAELTPGEGALTAPEWLPWAERLAEYEAAQAALAAEGLATDDLERDEDEDLDDVDDLDALDYDNDGSPILHSGDVDGVDIDELADDVDADGDELDDEDSDEDDEDSDDGDDADDEDSEDSDDEDSDDEDSDDGDDADDEDSDDSDYEDSDDEDSDDGDDADDEDSDDEDSDDSDDDRSDEDDSRS
jgi:hypothetical protein